ncbi:hypothetical protein GUJ93_ZPchr0014g46853 [Zizania palustris]|uniref:Uncharacterized protein n=1 Tax=Zizania palustris TaxID=103762 RepID=A0A8J5W6X8_ZIZPA|nr:hypothetical protein GUJ93_ZPchr0014g46853 [Zizania palustris]
MSVANWQIFREERNSWPSNFTLRLGARAIASALDFRLLLPAAVAENDLRMAGEERAYEAAEWRTRRTTAARCMSNESEARNIIPTTKYFSSLQTTLRKIPELAVSSGVKSNICFTCVHWMWLLFMILITS